MRKKLIILLAVIITAVNFLALTSYAETKNLLKNPDMEAVGEDGLPNEWLASAYSETGGTQFSNQSEVVYKGSYSAKIVNTGANDARFEQLVSVKSNTIYKLSAYIKTENITDTAGANLSLLDTWNCSDYIVGDQDWTKVEMYGKTASNMHEIIVCLRLGYYGSTITGTAYFDELTLEEVSQKDVPGGVVVEDWKEQEKSTANLSEDEAAWQKRVDGDTMTKWVTILFIVFLFGIYYFGVHSKRTLNDLEKAEQKSPAAKAALPVLILLALGVLIRLWSMTNIPIYQTDLAGCFQNWAIHIFNKGPANFYTIFCDYPPLYMLILWPIGAVKALFNIASDTQASYMLLMLPSILADLLSGLFIYKIARPRLGARMALIAMAAYIFNPAIWINSAGWGQIDSILALAIVLMIYFLLEKKQLAAFITFVLGMLLKPQMFIVSPILFFGVANDFIKTIREKKEGETGRFVGKFLINLAISLGIGFVIVFLFSFDFAAGKMTQPLTWIFVKFGDTLSQYNFLCLNTFNIYGLFDGSWVRIYDDAGISYRLFGLIPYSYLGVVALVLIVFSVFCLNFKKRDNKNLYLLAAFIITSVYMLMTKMHERYLIPAILAVLLAFIELKDKRLMAIFSAMSIGSFINVALVLYRTWILNANDDPQPVINVMSGFNLLWFGYFAYVVYDICIREQIKPFTENIKARIEAWIQAPKQRIQDEEAPARFNMKRIDVIIVLGITILYGVFSFIGLGTTLFPETYWKPTLLNEYVIGDLGAAKEVKYLYYAGSIGEGSFNISVSSDGENWTDVKNVDFVNGDMYKWNYATVPTETMRFVKVESKISGFNLLEVGAVTSDFKQLAFTATDSTQVSGQYKPVNVFDEQNTVPDKPSYYNSMYFDEIYHARTGYEFNHDMATYETTHPPLGKVFMAWSIDIFGMNPFGWRFAGNVFGILMIPLMYLFAKLLFKKTWIAVLMSAMMTFDGMHFAQTRIATIDVFGVFFIILMYMFMYQYFTMNFFKQKLSKTLIPLALSGIAFGLGAASKWIGLYAGLGLALLFFYTLYKRYDEYIYAKRNVETAEGQEKEDYERIIKTFGPNTVKTLLFCVLFFILIPAGIYIASYAYFVPYNRHYGYLRTVWENQKLMLSYHSGLIADKHPYRSSWYTWPVIARPIWYYVSDGAFMPADKVSTIASFGSPVVWWGALVGTVTACVQGARYRKKIDLEPLTEKEGIYQNRDLSFLLIALASQFIPWIFVPRSTFIYHYFASVPFIILLTGLVFARAYRINREKTVKTIIWALVVLVAVFALFYPIWSGMTMSNPLREALRILPSWYF